MFLPTLAITSLIVLLASFTSAVKPPPAAQQLKDLIAAGNYSDPATLHKIFNALPPAEMRTVWGTYKGLDLTPNPAFPDTIGWWGKRFLNESFVDPLLGTRNTTSGPVVYTYPRANIAQMREITFRGKSAAAIVYDKTPIMDYFRRVDGKTLLGLGDEKGKPLGPFFLLTKTVGQVVVEI